MTELRPHAGQRWCSLGRIDALTALAAVTLVFLAIFYFASEKIDYNYGFGMDGYEYGEAALRLSDPDYRPDQRIVQRILPSFIVHHIASTFSENPQPIDIVYGFIGLNFLCVIVVVLCWHWIADEICLSRAGETIGLIGLTWNFAIVKWNAFYPVLTDTTAFALGAAMALAWLKRSRAILLLLTLASTFVWQTGPYVGALLLALPRERGEPTSEIPGVPFKYRAIIAAALAATVVGYVMQRNGAISFPSLESSIYNSLILYALALLSVAAYLMGGAFSALNDRRLFDFWSMLGRVDYVFVAVFILAFTAIGDLQASWAAPGAQGIVSIERTIQGIAELTIRRPAIFIVSHVTYFGPIVVCSILVWPTATKVARELGVGWTAVILFTIVFSLTSESRHLILLLPFVMTMTVKALDLRGVTTRWSFLTFIALCSLWLAKPWLHIGKMRAYDPGSWPDVLFYMQLGPWIPYPLYVIQLGIAALIAWHIHFAYLPLEKSTMRQVTESVRSALSSPHLRLNYLLPVLIAVYAALLVLQINLPPLERYPNWDAFWDDSMMVGNLSGLRQALLALELPAISPYIDFGWNALGDTTLIQSYLNPIHWLVLIFDPTTVLVVRTFAFFFLGAFGSYLLLRHLTDRPALSFLGGVMFCALPVNFTLLYGTNELAFIYCTPLMLWIIHRVLEKPSPARLFGFAAYCAFATSAGDIFGLIALPPVIGTYAFLVGWNGFRRSLKTSFATAAALLVIWALASSFYIAPFIYNIAQNREFMRDIYSAGLAAPEYTSVAEFASMLMDGALPGLFKPNDAMLVLYLPVFCLIAIAAGVAFRRPLFRDRLAGASFTALILVCVTLVAVPFVFYAIPSLAATATGGVRMHILAVPALLLFASFVCIAHATKGPAKHAMGRNRPYARLVVLALLLALAIDVSLFVIPAYVPGSGEQAFYFIYHGGPQTPAISSPNLIPTRWLDDMWLFLPIANMAFALLALGTAGLTHANRGSIIAFCSAAILGGLIYASFQLDLRLQQLPWAWATRSDYRIATYNARRECVNELIERSDPSYRTFYTGKEIFAGTGRNYKLIAETELNVVDQQKALFSYRNTTHPSTALVWNSFRRNYGFRPFNFMPISAGDTEKDSDLVRRLGAKWIISADQPIKPMFRAVGDDFNFAWVIENAENLAGKTIHLEVLARTQTRDKFAVEVFDGVAGTRSQRHDGGGRWNLLMVDHQVAPGAKQVSIRVVQAAKISEPDAIDIATVRVLADNAELPVSLAGFSDWTVGQPFPPGWRFDGGADRARVERGHDITLKGECNSPPGPLMNSYEQGTVFVSEIGDPLGIAFFGDHYERLDRAKILRRIATGQWNEHAVLVEDEPPLSEPEMRRPRGEARVTADGFNRITVAAKTDTARPLVLTMTHRPFWSATVDGVETPIMRAYGGFMSVLVPAGEHVIYFKYVPWDGYVGLLLTLATLAGFGIAARSRNASRMLLSFLTFDVDRALWACITGGGIVAALAGPLAYFREAERLQTFVSHNPTFFIVASILCFALATASLSRFARTAVFGAAFCCGLAILIINFVFLITYPSTQYDAIRLHGWPPLPNLLQGRKIEFYPGAEQKHRLVTDSVIWESFGVASPVPGNYRDVSERLIIYEFGSEYETRIFVSSEPHATVFIFRPSGRNSNEPIRVFTGEYKGISASVFASEDIIAEILHVH
jgi:hypothetical protein